MILLEPAPDDGLEAFCLGEIEVTVAEYRRCLEAGVCDAIDPDLMDPPRKATLLGDDDQMPINFIGGDEGTQYCGFIGGRLPTEAEWTWAAESGKGQQYPWGSQTESDKEYYCGAWIRPGQNFTDPIPCRARQYSTDRTEQGIYDMMGSLNEIVAQDDEGNYGSAHPPATKGTEPNPSKVEYVSNKRTFTFRGWPFMYQDHLGLRCAGTPTP
ncbi:MAG: SUMF1/EgtB/PvdO family nonheme iron enzyme [Myxococcota bacterium]